MFTDGCIYMKIYNQSKILHVIRFVATEGSSWSGILEWNAEMGFGPDLFLSALFLVSALTYQTFKFKNIFLALSKSLLLAIATTVDTSFSSLIYLFYIFILIFDGQAPAQQLRPQSMDVLFLSEVPGCLPSGLWVTFLSE